MTWAGRQDNPTVRSSVARGPIRTGSISLCPSFLAAHVEMLDLST